VYIYFFSFAFGWSQVRILAIPLDI